MLEVSVIGYLIPPLTIYHLYSGGQFYWGVCLFFFYLFARSTIAFLIQQIFPSQGFFFLRLRIKYMYFINLRKLFITNVNVIPSTTLKRINEIVQKQMCQLHKT